MAAGLACPGLSGAMPGRATPKTVFCAEAMRAPAALADAGGAGGGDGKGASTSGGGGGEGKLGGAMPIIVAPSGRAAVGG